MMLIAAWTGLFASQISDAKAQRLATLSSGRALIASEVKRYHLETGLWPASLEALSATTGYEHLRQFTSTVNGGALASPTTPWSLTRSNVLNNGTIQYQRVGIIGLSDNSKTLANLLSYSYNTCNPTSSTADFSSTSNWCGNDKYASWSKTDTIELQGLREKWAYNEHNATATKIIRNYKATGTIPVVAVATPLYSLVTKVDTASVAGTTPATCLGQFYWQGMGFECGDLYNQFGNPVTYRNLAARKFELASTSQILNSAGGSRSLASTFDASTPLYVTQISAGGDHVCALTTAGGVKCWGYNAMGQLGNGTLTNSSVPVDVTGLTSGVTAISSGYNHSCALLSTGGLKCWGNNAFGHLGDGTLTQRTTPVDVSGMTAGVAKVAAGTNFTCAVTTAGAAKCWGIGTSGQLGNGGSANSSVAVQVSGLTSGIAQVTGGSSHACALSTAGAVKCWGLNTSGQLGDGTTTARLVPTAVPLFSVGGAASISAQGGGNHTCAVTTTGGAKCWGNNGSGQVGNNTLVNAVSPVDVSGLTSGVANVSAGGLQTCAVTTTGAAKCWGQGTQGQLGNSGVVDSKVPVAVTGWATSSGALSSGYQHACGSTTRGLAACWGKNTYGAVGDATTTSRSAPVTVAK